MRRLIWTLLLAIVVAPQPAGAVTFDWSYSGANANGSGTFDAVDNGSGRFTIGAISGTANKFTITGLSDYFGPDKFLFTTPGKQLDIFGFSFTVENGDSYNILYSDALSGFLSCGDGAGYCQVGPGAPGSNGSDDNIVSIEFSASIAEAPLPAALPLFAAGAGLLGLFGLQRSRRKAQRRAVAAYLSS
jgi:hypothetical protein